MPTADQHDPPPRPTLFTRAHLWLVLLSAAIGVGAGLFTALSTAQRLTGGEYRDATAKFAELHTITDSLGRRQTADERHSAVADSVMGVHLQDVALERQAYKRDMSDLKRLACVQATPMQRDLASVNCKRILAGAPEPAEAVP